MSAGVLNIVIEQGATFSRTIQVKDSLGAAVDLSDVTAVRGQVREDYAASTPYAFTLAVVDAAAGTISWLMADTITATIPARNPQQYVYDVELVRASGVTRLLRGAAIISPEVTR